MDTEWYESEQSVPADQVTIVQLQQLCDAVLSLRGEVEAKELEVKAMNTRLTNLENKALAYIRDMNLHNFKHAGFSFGIYRRRSWALPKTEDQRTAFFNYLRERGVYDAMVSVNSATYNSFLKEQFELAEKNGESAGFQVPGVGDPSVFEKLSVAKERGK